MKPIFADFFRELLPGFLRKSVQSADTLSFSESSSIFPTHAEGELDFAAYQQ
jgi:hypothetical protein